MSVIVKGMKMPRNCMFCPLYVKNSVSKNCAVTDKWNAVSGINRLDDCPLKSVEGLIEEIEHHRMKTAPIDKYDLVGDCINIIKEYCEVSDNSVSD